MSCGWALSTLGLLFPGAQLPTLAARFYGKCATLIDGAWNTDAVESLRRPLPGPRPAGLGLMHRYIDNVLALTHNHPVVSEAFGSSVHMIVGPFHLFKPAVLRPCHDARNEVDSTGLLQQLCSSPTRLRRCP